jgi:hypothetical protein
MYQSMLQKNMAVTHNPNAGIEGIIKTLISSFRNYSLYPDDHTLSTHCIKHITSELIKYTEGSGNLSLTIEKDGIYSDSKKFYSCNGEDDAFVYPMIRDGILRIDFLQGIQGPEIKRFFDIIKKNRTLPDDPDSDTVTDLWQADFPHVQYQASEVFWDSEPVFTFPNPTLGFPEPPPSPPLLGQASEKRSDGAFSPGPGGLTYEPSFFEPANLDGPQFEGTDLSFTPEELTKLRTMVQEEDENRKEDDTLDLLLLVIDEITSADDLENTLINLADEFLRVLQNGDSYKAFTIIEKVMAYQNKHGWMRSFVEGRVTNFMAHLSGPVLKESLPGIVAMLNRNKPEEIFFFRKICAALDATSVLALCDALVFLESQSSRDLLMDIIRMKTREDAKIISLMLKSNDKMMALIGVSLLKGQKDNNSDVMLQQVLNHPIEQVRSSALDYYTEKPVSTLPRIFYLIDDRSMDIKIKLLKYIGSKRAVISENLMLDYLKQKPLIVEDKDHLLNCYKILGKCGSNRSIPFLKKKLFGGSWIGFSGSKGFEHRAGALLALSELGSSEALLLLKKASKSKVPVISKAYKKYIE